MILPMTDVVTAVLDIALSRLIKCKVLFRHVYVASILIVHLDDSMECSWV
jgi:hypothetical protein